MAMAYRAVNLLPDNHRYLQSGMIGSYGIRDVLRETAQNIDFKWKNIDKIIIFFAFIIGIILLGIQFVFLLFAMVIGSASAQDAPANYGEFFVLDGRENDVALRLLDKVFGVPGIFGTNEPTETPFHIALHQLFQFYSIGLIVIAAIILAYFIFAIIAETAQTGTPFGKRYNHVWAPIRLVAAIGLLVPISYGLNAGQWITLYAAKFGSGFASNGWIQFNETMNDTLLDGEELIARPNPPEVKEWIAFMFMAHACKRAYEIQVPDVGNRIEAWIIDTSHMNDPQPFTADVFNSPPDWLYDDQFINIRFGVFDPEAYPDAPSNVFPHCGELVFTNVDNAAIDAPDDGMPNFTLFANSMAIYYGIYTEYMWNAGEEAEGEAREAIIDDLGLDPDNLSPADQAAIDQAIQDRLNDTRYTQEEFDAYRNDPDNFDEDGNPQDPDWQVGDIRPNDSGIEIREAAYRMIESRLRHQEEEDPDPQLRVQWVETLKNDLAGGIEATAVGMEGEYQVDPRIAELGWGGAGIWYNQIASANGALVNAVMNKPNVSQYAHLMTYTCNENRQQNDDTSPTECYDPSIAEVSEIQYNSEDSRTIAAGLGDTFDFWFEDDDMLTGNAFIDTINVVLGTQGLFDMCANADYHPLAQLSSAGKALVEAAIRNLGFGLGFGAAGILAPYFGPALQAASGFFVSVASIGILIGFILYYVVPFMPFLYFLFAVGGWVKGLFEAMVGVPLWALAHLRIDGQGLPGDGAINGYFLIFEIFLRPILIIFGLLASVVIFGAMIKVLNEIFSLVVSNLSGFSTANSSQCGQAFDSAAGAPTGSIDYLRGPVDEFFFTIVYAILVYMIGMASFKLIDLIPNQILRWMGAGVSTFNDQAGEPAEGLVTKLAVGGGIMGGQLQQAGQGATQAASSFGRVAADFAMRGNN